MKKRIISLILALALCVGMLPAPAWAEEPTDPTQAVEVVGAANPSEETDPTTEPTEEETEPTEGETEPTEAETEPTEGETEPTEAPKAAEVPAEETAAPGEDEAVAAVQAMIDALPDVDHMSEEYIDALVEAYSAYETLSESQQAQITGVEKLEALFNWVNSQVSTLAAEETISGEVNWNNRTFTTPVKLTGETTLTLVGDNKIECEKPLDLNGHKLTIQGTGSLELVGSNNDGNYYNSGTIYDSTWTGTSYTGGGMVIESGTVIARADVKNAVAVRYLYMDGGKLEAYGARAGIVTTELQMTDGSLYATGSSKCGINIYSNPRFVSVNGLNILVSNEPNAQEADMEDGTISQIQDSEKKTVAIGKFSTSPSISVQPQQGYLGRHPYRPGGSGLCRRQDPYRYGRQNRTGGDLWPEGQRRWGQQDRRGYRLRPAHLHLRSAGGYNQNGSGGRGGHRVRLPDGWPHRPHRLPVEAGRRHTDSGIHR